MVKRGVELVDVLDGYRYGMGRGFGFPVGVFLLFLLLATSIQAQTNEWAGAKWGSTQSEVLRALAKKGVTVLEKKPDQIIAVDKKTGIFTEASFKSGKLCKVLITYFPERWTTVYQGVLRDLFSVNGWDSEHRYHEALTVSTDPSVLGPTYFLSKDVERLCSLLWIAKDRTTAFVVPFWSEPVQTFVVSLTLTSGEELPVETEQTKDNL